ncbi:hypothetical protein Q3G72_007880 [Acer saccharum]|nr:hypothetical protein Q3G72_007880 [Acer saccharum]
MYFIVKFNQKQNLTKASSSFVIVSIHDPLKTHLQEPVSHAVAHPSQVTFSSGWDMFNTYSTFGLLTSILCLGGKSMDTFCRWILLWNDQGELHMCSIST